jgi:hypothetical protein
MQRNESPHFLVDSHFEIWGPALVPISSWNMALRVPYAWYSLVKGKTIIHFMLNTWLFIFRLKQCPNVSQEISRPRKFASILRHYLDSHQVSHAPSLGHDTSSFFRGTTFCCPTQELFMHPNYGCNILPI